VLAFRKKEILNTIRKNPDFAEFFITYLLQRNARIEEDLVDQLFNSSEKRLARVLLLLAHFGKNEAPEVVQVSQETLAKMVGTTRPRVSFFMNKFRRLGFIDYEKGLRVHPSLLAMVLRD
jgi:CRP-like cAMP-binding protein